MLHWNTVDQHLKDSLLLLMRSAVFKDFRLVGGTALSLHLGHRLSIDIDLFTDATYGSIDFGMIDDFLRKNFAYVSGDFGGNPGMGKSYLVGTDENNLVKIDLYYAAEPFSQEVVLLNNIRMASIEEIAAMKMDVIQRGGRKKDFWDIHALLDHFSLESMMALHANNFEWTHEKNLLLDNLTNFEQADGEPDPICLQNKEWIFIKEDLIEAKENS